VDPKAIDRRCCRFTGEALLEKLGLKGVLTSARFDPKTNMIEVYFLGYGGMHVIEGMESPSMTPERWEEIDNSYLEEVEEELVNQWESD
jgi:hypothetical protein